MDNRPPAMGEPEVDSAASRNRPWRAAVVAVTVVALAVGTAAVMLGPTGVRDLVLGGSCPDGLDGADVPPTVTAPRPSSTVVTDAPMASPIDSVAVVNDRRVPALWPFASDSPWNLPLGDEAAFSERDDPRLEQLRGGRAAVNIDEFSIEIYEADETDPIESVDAVINAQTFDVAIPSEATPSAGSDGNLNVVQPDGVTLWEHWIMRRGSDGWIAEYAVDVELTGTGIAAGVRAYGGSTAAGLIRAHELEEGQIPHAIAMAVCRSQLRNGPVWPAYIEDGGGTDTGEYSGLLPMGSLLAIPPDVDLDALDLSASGLAVARAYQRYGGYITDSAGSSVIAYVEPSTPKHLWPTDDDASVIRDLLRVVDNADEANPGGPGDRIAPLAPPLP